MSVNESDDHHAGPSKADATDLSPKPLLTFNIPSDVIKSACAHLLRFVPDNSNNKLIEENLDFIHLVVYRALSKDSNRCGEVCDSLTQFHENIKKSNQAELFDLMKQATANNAWESLLEVGVHGMSFISFYRTRPAHDFV